MSKRRHLRVIDGGDGGGDDNASVQRVLCRDCRFREERDYEHPRGSGRYRTFDACMVNRQQKCLVHNPNGMCTKFESAAAAFVSSTRRLILRLQIVGGVLVISVVTALILWLYFG